MKRPRESSSARICFGDILQCTDGVIVHQCNTVSTEAKGLAAAVFDRWPQTNLYIPGNSGRAPGKMQITNVDENLFVCNLYAQRYPGKPVEYETAVSRVKWFRDATFQLKKWVDENAPATVYFPFGIGCGFAGGNHETYMDMILEFAENVNCNVVIVKQKIEY